MFQSLSLWCHRYALFWLLRSHFTFTLQFMTLLFWKIFFDPWQSGLQRGPVLLLPGTISCVISWETTSLLLQDTTLSCPSTSDKLPIAHVGPYRNHTPHLGEPLAPIWILLGSCSQLCCYYLLNSFYPQFLDFGFTCYVLTIVPGTFTFPSCVIIQQSYGEDIVISVLPKRIDEFWFTEMRSNRIWTQVHLASKPMTLPVLQ